VGALTQNEILILAALRGGERYGREVMEQVEALTDGRYKLALGGLYTTLHRMEKKGLIAGRWGERRSEEPFAQRRYYRITGVGQKLLAEVGAALTPALRTARATRS
jgi:DNA-binding PadR family transcriptional regulator